MPDYFQSNPLLSKNTFGTPFTFRLICNNPISTFSNLFNIYRLSALFGLQGKLYRWVRKDFGMPTYSDSQANNKEVAAELENPASEAGSIISKTTEPLAGVPNLAKIGHCHQAQRLTAVQQIARKYGNTQLQRLLQSQPKLPQTTTIQRTPQVGWSDAATQSPNAGETRVPLNPQNATTNGTRRIPVSGLRGGTGENDAQRENSRQQRISQLTGESAQHRAIVIIPDNLRLNATNPTADILLHFHGTNTGFRRRRGQNETMDVSTYQIEQQLQASGRTDMIGILPQGAFSGNHSEFNVNRESYIQEIFDFLNTSNLWRPGQTLQVRPGQTVLSGHSGGGLEISHRMQTDLNQARQSADHNPNPNNIRGVFMFDAIHAGDLSTVENWVVAQLNNDLQHLNELAQRFSNPAERTTQQLGYLQHSMFFRGFNSESDQNEYDTRYRQLTGVIDNWFNRGQRRQPPRLSLSSIMSQPVIDAFANNYRVTSTGHGRHENTMNQGRNNSQPLRDSLSGLSRLLQRTPEIQSADSLVLPANRTNGVRNLDLAPACQLARIPAANPAIIQRERARRAPADDSHVLEEGVRGYTAASGFYRRYPASTATHVTNQTGRPQIRLNPAEITGSFEGTRLHTAVVEPLGRMMAALRAEGDRLDDASLKLARVASGFRTIQQDGQLFLNALLRTIRENDQFAGLTFPGSLEDLARSDLHNRSDLNNFISQLGASTGWTAELAQEAVRITQRTKAPAGASTHHSGVVVDIDFPYVSDASTIEWHGMSRSRNAPALRSAAGVWLSQHASEYGFSSYDTNIEIWHQEWLNWQTPLASARRI